MNMYRHEYINRDFYNIQTAMNDQQAERREALKNVIKNHSQAPPGLFTLYNNNSAKQLCTKKGEKESANRKEQRRRR